MNLPINLHRKTIKYLRTPVTNLEVMYAKGGITIFPILN